ncbi:putative pentatricopeptide repeat-containing protein PPR5 [Helianthus debilis subsp. tardiflorus]
MHTYVCTLCYSGDCITGTSRMGDGCDGKERSNPNGNVVFSEIRNSGCRPDTSVYNSLITAHLHSKDKSKALSKALGYFEKMKVTERCKPSIVTYNILLRAFAQAKNVAQVEALFKDLEESICTPDIYTFNGMMDAYGKNGMVGEMEGVLARMKSNQVKPDIITYNLLIDSYGRKQKFEKMEQVLKSLLRSKERPTVSTFNSMITNYGKARLRDKAETVFHKITDMGYAPNFITYECMITMYGCDCVSKARRIYDNMIETEKHLKVSTLNDMLNVYCLNSLPIEADKLFETACNSGMFRIDSSMYKLLYKSYTKANMTDLIQKLLKHMDRGGIVPNKRFFLEALGALGSSQADQDAITAKVNSNMPVNMTKI